MKKRKGAAVKILPVMARKGIIRNGNVYFPYLAAGIFSVFTYFVYASILYNDIIRVLPKSAYAWMMLRIGKSLLVFILMFFLIYANSFLVKRRQKEFGLYHILGLEKKHIGGMMFFETIIAYVSVLAGGVIFGLVLSKLLFMVLLYMCGLPVDIAFHFSPAAFRETMLYFLVIYLINLAAGLVQVGKARPVELMSGSKKGEKEPKFLWFYALLGAAALAGGYHRSVTSQIDSMIFIDFFVAVFLVIVGTYLLFTSGSIAFLKWMKGRKAVYYRPGNFITISGMLYRMKKSAAGLANICIFSTMVVITLSCTVTVYAGLDSMVHFIHPYDMTVHYRGEEKVTREEVWEETTALEEKYGLEAAKMDVYDTISLEVRKQGNSFVIRRYEEGVTGIDSFADDYRINVMTLEDYNRTENRAVSLKEDEVLIYCSGEDYGYDTVDFFGKELCVKEELKNFFPEPKAKENTFGASYFMVVKDEAAQDACAADWARANGVEDMESFLNSGTRYVQLFLEGEDEKKDAFLAEFGEWCQGRPGFSKLDNECENRNSQKIMFGALLFLGVLFGLIFFMCLILIMYYKQITEGYEDRDSFAIMQKVGMSDTEIRSTVHRQILMVFGMPLLGAVCHTLAGMVMVKGLLAILSFFRQDILFGSTVCVIILFAAVYGVSYMITAKAYYGIVRKKNSTGIIP